MNALRPGEVARMQAVQAESLGDTFTLGTHSQSLDSSGGLTDVYSDSGPQSGAIGAPSSRAAYLADKVLVSADAILRVTDDATLAVGDRITVTARNGTPVTPETFYITGPARVFATAVVYPLGRTQP